MRRVLTTGLVAALLAVGGCASDDENDAVGTAATSPAETSPAPTAAGERLDVVAVTDVYGDIARTIGGDRVEVTSIIEGAGADPHSYEATARTQLAVQDADLVIANGGHYDEFLTQLLGAAGGDRTVLTAVEAAHHEAETADAEPAETADAEPAETEPTQTEDDAAEHDHGAEGNEHVWYDLKAMSSLATEIADALSRLDPASRTAFQDNAAQFRSELAELMERQDQIASAHDGTAIAVTEPVPLYLLTDCGLVDKTPSEFSQAIEEGSDVPVRVLQETLALFSDGAVKVLVYNEQTTGPQTERVRAAADSAGIPVVGVSETLPAGEDYLSWMSANLDALEEALG